LDVKILDPKQSSNTTQIVFGLLAVIYGVSVYVLLPLSLLEFNFGLLLRIFFFILLGLMFGLALLASNVQRLLEMLLVYTVLAWEKSSMKRLVLKNLTAHKERNKLTGLIYSLSIAFLIFLIVSYNIEVQVIS
jgi:hypothetical protein